MKSGNIFEFLIGGLLLVTFCFPGCKESSGNHYHEHDHHGGSGASAYDSIPNAKILFPGNDPDRVILNLTADPLHSVAVNWRTSADIKEGTVEVAEATDGPEFKASGRSITAATEYLVVNREGEPEVNANYHSAVIDDLEQGKRYVYRVGAEPYWSEWYQIEMPLENGPVSFIYFGDAQNDVKSMWSRVIREAYHTIPKVDFMLHAGDLINRHDRDVEWGEWFYAGSFIHAMVPAMMTPGNHEYKDVVLSPQWRPQFNLPKNGPAGLEETCYVIDFPQMKVVSLDAEQIDESEHFRNLQALWLDSILSNDPKKWTVITFHYPVFSTNPDRDNLTLRESFKPLFDKHHVDLVLQGHDHAYGRGMVNNIATGASVRDGRSGTMYVVSVSGPKMYDISDDKWMERRAANTQLFQVIRVSGDTAAYKAYTAKGELYDAFDLVKKAGKPNVLINKIPNTPERTE
jgi:acid phosphatase type 7